MIKLVKFGFAVGSMLLCASAGSAEMSKEHSTGPKLESLAGLNEIFMETTPLLEGTQIEGESASGYEVSAMANNHSKRLINQGSVSMSLSIDGKLLSWAYDTGWVPDVYGPAGVCDQTFYSGFVPTGNIAITIDGVVIGTLGLSTGGMGVTNRGTCYMQGTTRSSDGLPFPPGNFVIQGRLLQGNQLASTSGSFSVQACSGYNAGSNIYSLRYNAITDNFYTSKFSDIALLTQYGWLDRGVAFKSPPKAAAITGAQNEFRRFYKGAPQYEHFYSTATSDRSYLASQGYVDEGVEGYVYKTAKQGSTALYRYTRFYPASGDLEHYYTTQTNDPTSAGMTYEGIVGYVCSK